MTLTRLDIAHLRNIASATLAPAPRVNLIVGDNGSGKTSLLEAIYLLGRTRSFRTGQAARLVQFEHPELLVSGIISDADGVPTSIGLRLSRSERELRVGGQRAQSSADAARCFPVLVMHPASVLLVEGPPSLRRQFMDWGVFHVEHRYLEQWRNYSKALNQRNALLRARRGDGLSGWNQELARYGTIVASARDAYLQRLDPYVLAATQHFFPGVSIRLEHAAGWRSGRTLSDALGEDVGLDVRNGYTASGPHKGDFSIFVDERPAKSFFSRGQSKLMAYALLLAQASLLESVARPPCLLIDDLSSELDRENRRRLTTLLRQRDGQCFITATHASAVEGLPADAAAMFHVEHGRISPN
ncbi:MAG: DNA replication/repair protein RecF [Methylotetracoccus sp.]